MEIIDIISRKIKNFAIITNILRDYPIDSVNRWGVDQRANSLESLLDLIDTLEKKDELFGDVVFQTKDGEEKQTSKFYETYDNTTDHYPYVNRYGEEVINEIGLAGKVASLINTHAGAVLNGVIKHIKSGEKVTVTVPLPHSWKDLKRTSRLHQTTNSLVTTHRLRKVIPTPLMPKDRR